MDKTLFKELAAAGTERQVEDAYNAALKRAFPGIEISYPCNCDGYFKFEVSRPDGEKRQYRVLIEYKLDEDMNSKAKRSKVLAQAVFYLKKFEAEGIPTPNVVFVADRNECFVVHTNHLTKWLDLGVDWNAAPSHAAEAASDLMLALTNDESCNAYVFSVDEELDFSAVSDKIVSEASGQPRRIRITEHNVDKIFGVFKSKILAEKKISPNDAVALFFAVVTGDDNVYLHPKQKNTLVRGASTFRINAGNFKAFCEHFKTECTPSEKAHLAAISDRLIEDMNRRRKGEFYTPTPWVDEAHRRASAFLGENWRDECVVVDTSCGTKNLERDYRFSELYLSTLEPAELEISRQYCPGAKATAVLDFLNSTDEELFAALPGLEDALKADRKIVWLMNPPYLRANKKDHTDVAASLVNKQMNAEKFGKCSANLYTQFLYRIVQLKKKYNATNFVLAFFCKPGYLTAGDFKKFRELFLNEFKFEDGMLFNAGHFADTASTWGINFSIWSSGETVDKNAFKHDLMDMNNDGDIIKIGEKELYNIDGKKPMPEWLREAMIGVEKVKALPLTNAISVKADGRVYMELLAKNALGFFFSKANDVQHSGQESSIFTSVLASGMGGGINVLPDNFARCCAAFAARRLVKGDWVNDKDEYTAPNVDDPAYRQFEADSLVFSLFDSNSQQSSLRGVEYKGRKWDVRNQFCWYSKAEAERLADECGLDAVYEDARTSEEPYMAKALAEAEGLMSDEAKAVLEKARELVEKSFKYRGLFAEDNPEYQTDKVWDLGWYQLKAILKEYMPAELAEFRGLVKALADKMRPQVYALGFLRA